MSGYDPNVAVQEGINQNQSIANNAQTGIVNQRKNNASNALIDQYGPTAGDPEATQQVQANAFAQQMDPLKVHAAQTEVGTGDLQLNQAKLAQQQQAELRAAMALKDVTDKGQPMDAAFDTIVAPNADLLGLKPEDVPKLRAHLMANPQTLDAMITGLQGQAKPMSGGDQKQYTMPDGTLIQGYTDERGQFHKTQLPDGAQPLAPLSGGVQTQQLPDGSWAYGRMSATGQMVWAKADGTPVAGMRAETGQANAQTGAYRAGTTANNSLYGAAPGTMPGAIEHVESGGNPNAVSPKGAQGLMQLMPGTASSPGFGIEPVKNGSPAENMRVGSQYYAAMLKKYGGNVSNALAAYNWGPGNVDNWLKTTGGSPAALPAETRSYIGNVLTAARSSGGVQNLFSAQETQGGPSGQAGPLFNNLPPKGRIAATSAAQGIVNGGQQLQSIDDQIGNIQKLIGPASIGLGSLTAPIPGTPASNLHAALSTLRSQGLTSWLNSLKNASGSTGIGRVLQSEATAAMNSFGALEQSQSEGQFRYHLGIFQTRVHQLQANAEHSFKSQYGVDPYSAMGVPAAGGAQASAPASSGWSVVGVR